MPTVQEIISSIGPKMQKSVDALVRDLSSVRTGRASGTLVENIQVEYYGTLTPLNQIASISVPETTVIMIQPWDKNAIDSIEKGILKSQLGVVPNNDGTVIRINIPPLTEERRKDLVKMVAQKIEQSHIAIRNIRRDSQNQFREMQKTSAISEDDSKKSQEQLQNLTDKFIQMTDDVGNTKKTEIMEI